MTLFQTTVPSRSARYLIVLLSLSVIAIASLLTALTMGSVDIPLADVLQSLFSKDETLTGKIINNVRLPRVQSGFVVGAMLALAGALMQILLRNPLAEPYVLGVSGGASVFALLAMSAGLGGFWINGSAFAGALLSIVLVFVLSYSRGNWNPMRILLTGVVIAAGWGALISFMLSISPAGKVHGMLFWLMGDLSFTTYSAYSGIILLLALMICMVTARSMNILARGELDAAALGVPVSMVRYLIYFIASLLTAMAVMQAGSIGFVGLIVPHSIRLLFGSDHRLLFPASALLGGSLLVVADGLARTVIAPQQLPVGVLTAMLGVPVFLLLLHSSMARQRP